MSGGTGKIYDFTVNNLAGTPIDLGVFKGKVLLIVNTASQCGFTPQYHGLETLYRQFGERGFEVLGFPCNQFGGQEPGNAAEIGVFCDENYGISFPMFEKIAVNGDQAAPLFRYLKRALPGVLGSESIKWNFTKFLVKKDGTAYKRYAPQTKPEQLAGDIEQLLAE